MKTTLISVLALVALAMVGSPAYARGGRHGGGHSGGGHAMAFHGGGGGHHSFGGGHAFAAHHTGRTFVAGRGGAHTFARHKNNSNLVAANRVRATGAGRAFAARGSAVRGVRPGTFAANRNAQAKPNIAFGGNAYNYGNRGNGQRGYNGWNGGNNGWNGGNYGWNRGGWGWDYGWGNPYAWDYLYPGTGIYPYFGYDNFGPETYSDVTGGSVSTEVQQDLARDGYYHGPIDGIVGPGTSSAIAAYQQANGLPVTGAINGALLQSLGLQ